MKFIKFLALILGFAGSVLSLNSCKKDEPDVITQECCTASMAYYGSLINMKACEDGTQTISQTNVQTGVSTVQNDRWDTEYTWAYMKMEAMAYGGTCAQE